MTRKVDHVPASPHVMHITGARPNFPKAAPVMAALAVRGVRQSLVHTGQHYDDNMSGIFFRELGLREPDVNLGVGSGTQAEQTAAIMVKAEELLSRERPDLVMVYGDVNSTVAAVLVAAKLGIRTAHVEAGLRSFDRSMPEEINRVVVDRLSDLLLATSADAVAHLAREGADPERIHLVGNPMIDTLLRLRPRFETSAAERFGLTGGYVVATLHRPGNVDSPDSVRLLVKALHALADQAPLILPLHPRGRENLVAAGLLDHPALHVSEPLGYLSFMGLIERAACVVTDSGGIQEETTVLGVPCLTVRPNTERPVTITHGTNRLVTVDDVPDRLAEVLAAGRPQSWPVPPLWDGSAGERTADVTVRFLQGA